MKNRERACLPCPPCSGPNWKRLTSDKASFLPWWGQKNSVGRVGLGSQGLPVIGSAWAPLALSTLHSRQPAPTRVVWYRYFMSQRLCIVPGQPPHKLRICRAPKLSHRAGKADLGLKSVRAYITVHTHNTNMTGNCLNDLLIAPGS